jgi:hypothetical protein
MEGRSPTLAPHPHEQGEQLGGAQGGGTVHDEPLARPLGTGKLSNR